MKNKKILAIVLTAGMMTGMMVTPAAVSAADVNPLEQLVNEMSDQILPNPDAETAETNNDSNVLADAGSENDNIDPSFSQYDSILAPSSIKRQLNQQKPHQQKMSILQVKSSVPDRMHRAYGMEVLPEHRLQYPFPGMEFIQSL